MSVGREYSAPEADFLYIEAEQVCASVPGSPGVFDFGQYDEDNDDFIF